MILSQNTWKKLVLFHVFFLVLQPVLKAQEFYSLLNNVFDRSELSRLTLADLQLTRLKVTTGYAYQDYYRETIPDIGDQTLSGENSSLSLLGVNAQGHIKYGFTASILSQSQHFSNMDAALDVNADYLHKTNMGNLQLALATERLVWGLGFQLEKKSFDTPILINVYPASDDLQMNRFFLDWLEPSFGNELQLQGEFDLLAFQAYSTITLGSDLLVGLHYSQAAQKFSPYLDYVNDSNIPELQGDRRMIFDGAFGNQCLEIRLERPGWFINPRIKLQQTHADMDILNTLPESIIDDFHEYGTLQLDRTGAVFGIGTQLSNVNVDAGIGYSEWDGVADLKTPVLGRTWFIPISHAAQLSVSGRSVSQQFMLHREMIKGNFSVGMNAGYQHAYFDLRVRGNAELEFNIRSVPIDSPYQFHLHAISFGLPLSYSFNSFSLGYEFGQLLPWFKRVDDSELSLQGAGSRPGKKARGGGEHMITLSWGLR